MSGNIIFDADSIRAIRDGRKTQTRRVVKIEASGRVRLPGSYKNWHLDDPNAVLACPYGRVGDLVWVRETYSCNHSTHVSHAGLLYRATVDNDSNHHGRWATLVDGQWLDFYGRPMAGSDRRWRSPIHMPRWASRLTLELTDVRVQRVQDISYDDCIDEGWHPADGQGADTWFRDRWDGIHGGHIGRRIRKGKPIDRWENAQSRTSPPKAWASNPWVWALTFTPIWKNIDAVLAERGAA